MYYNIIKKNKERMMNMTNLKELFVNNNNNTNQGVTNRGNQHNKTAALTMISANIAEKILKIVNTNVEKYQTIIVESMQSHDAMNNLINEIYDLATVDIDFLKAESEEILNKMIKSQQSRRSRAKGRAMTLENYIAMLTGAVAENLLRLAANKPKTAGGGARRSTAYSEEELEMFKHNPEALKRAIRNVQSKKSIARSKSDFDPDSDKWKELLETEAQLKALRDGQSAEKTNQIKEMLATVDFKDLKSTDAKELLASIKEMLAK